jgi:hypothetical protein
MDKAQAEFIKEQVLSELGGYYDKVKPNSYPILERILIKAGEQFNKQVGKNLKKSRAINTGALLDVKVPTIKYLGNYCILEIGYEDDSKQAEYYDFVDKGVRGTANEKADSKTKYKFDKSKKAIPVDVVRSWLKNKGSKSLSIKRARPIGVEKQKRITANAESAPYMIARSIHRKGLRSTHYFSDALKLVFDTKFKQALSVALGGEVNIKIRQAFKNKFK